MSTRPLLGIVLACLLVASLAPTVTATHRTIHDSAIDRSAATPHEDDGQVFNAPGHGADGRTNRVVYPGQTIGAGGLFLDARMANHVGPSFSETSGVDVSPGVFLVPLGFSRDVFIPTGSAAAYHVSAWYGWWNDLNGDRVIDDVHDASCGTEACATDEFLWRGLASNENLAMSEWSRPYPAPFSQSVALGGTGAGSDFPPMVDHTARDRTEQAWEGGFDYEGVDGGFLAEFQTFVIAGARPSVGAPLGFDLSDPDALWDVDTYHAIHPDVGALWTSTIRAAYKSIGDAQGTATGAVAPLTAIADAAVQPARDALTAAIGLVTAAREGTEHAVATFNLAPPIPREPNHLEDDYESRALFDGVADVRGAYNSYPGYADGHHFWMDVIALQKGCAGAYAVAASTTVSHGGTCLYPRSTAGVDDFVGGARGSETRTAGVIMWLRASLVAWSDLNRDHELGTRCDADSAMFDSERGVCDESYPTVSSNGEVRGICTAADLRGGTATVTPLTSDWENVVVVRDAAQPSYVAFGASPEIPEGRTPVALRFSDNCLTGAFGQATLDSRDALVFSLGSNTIPLKVVTRAKVSQFSDTGRGIEIVDEAVTDVDYIPAAL